MTVKYDYYAIVLDLHALIVIPDYINTVYNLSIYGERFLLFGGPYQRKIA